MIKNIVTFVCLFVSLHAGAQGWKVTFQRSYNDKVQGAEDPLLVFADKDQTIITTDRATQSQAKYPYETYYIDRNNAAYFKQMNFSADKQLVTKDLALLGKSTYNLTNETKVILGYTCKKSHHFR